MGLRLFFCDIKIHMGSGAALIKLTFLPHREWVNGIIPLVFVLCATLSTLSL